MAEFAGGNEEYISAREPIVFENKTESQYEVCAGIVFHKSGIYEVSVVGNKTIVSEVLKRKSGKWIDDKCSVCGKGIEDLISSSEWYRNEYPNFCMFCGAKMGDGAERGDKECS